LTINGQEVLLNISALFDDCITLDEDHFYTFDEEILLNLLLIMFLVVGCNDGMWQRSQISPWTYGQYRPVCNASQTPSFSAYGHRAWNECAREYGSISFDDSSVSSVPRQTLA